MDKSQIRYRKVDSEDSPNSVNKSNNMRRGPPPYRLLRTLFYILGFLLASLSMIVILNNSWPFKGKSHKINIFDKISVTLGLQERIDVVVIDAGSTGSRVLAFTFHRLITDNSLKLSDDELWFEVKPGLSSYADNPKKGAETLLTLLKKAKKRIPKGKLSSTPLVLRATAGLRMLPEGKAKVLLKEVENIIRNSGFLTSDKSVEIMDGKEEGIFSWFTSNYLSDRIGGTTKETIAALDLGGGSTQITFLPSDNLGSNNEDFYAPITFNGQDTRIFTHSFSGLGLMASRAAVLSKQSSDTLQVNSSCINPVVSITWTYGNKQFTIRGPSNPQTKVLKGSAARLDGVYPIADFKDCVRLCKELIKDKVKYIPSEVATKDVIAFSYFFDIATERGLIDPKKGGVVTVEKLIKEAKEACEIPNVDQPFACLDMTLISTILHDGYGLDHNKPIRLFKKINGHELSWALGLAYHVVSNGL